MEDSKIDMIFAGNFDRLERVKHPIIRVYLSSTYTDMTMEKSILVTEVYPKVKEYCRERYGAEFQVAFSAANLQLIIEHEFIYLIIMLTWIDFIFRFWTGYRHEMGSKR